MANIFNPYKSLQEKIRRNSVQPSKRSDSVGQSDLASFLKKLQSDLISNGRISQQSKELKELEFEAIVEEDMESIN